jgi:hypothetical protein
MIIAIKRDDGVTFGVSNKAACCDMSVGDYTHTDNLTVWKVKGNSGCYAAAELDFSSQLIRAYARSLSKVQGPNDITGKVIPEIKDMLGDFGLMEAKGVWANEMMIVKDGRLYFITVHFVLEEVDDFAVVGRNSSLQKGVLEATKGQPAEERILEAYRFMEKARGRNYFPVVLFDTKTGRKKVVTK